MIKLLYILTRSPKLKYCLIRMNALSFLDALLNILFTVIANMLMHHQLTYKNDLLHDRDQV